MDVISEKVYARVGLVGNPSDGYNGKTISMSILNFHAQVILKKNDKIILIPNQKFDRNTFTDFNDLRKDVLDQGYSGGISLMKSTCKVFFDHCLSNNIDIENKLFSLEYDTSIPRQVGLAGSSAIILATLKCLLKYFNIESTIEKVNLPQFVLDIEMKELNICAGLQDRVIQVYEGMVYMDFNKKQFQDYGHGIYEEMSIDDMPPFWLAYSNVASESGRAHNDIRKKYDNGDTNVIDAMHQFANLAFQAKSAINNKDWKELCRLMDVNFELRRSTYTDKCIGNSNLRMINIGKKYGSSVKFSGSGGAVLGCCLNPEKLKMLKLHMLKEGFSICDLILNKTNTNT